jgi:hypothetical protein
MTHEPKPSEYMAAARAFKPSGPVDILSFNEALTAANAIRDKRIRDEALEEAALAADEYFTTKAAVRAIRALKDKPDDPQS